MRLKEKLKSFLYAIPFGMKAGDELLTTSNDMGDEGSTIQKQVEKRSVFQDLLNGELTQEVEELRYETFKAEEDANQYQYIGSGQAVKKSGDESTRKNKRKKFVQYNVVEEYGVHESLVMMEKDDDRKKDDWKERRIFKATYKNPGVRFKIENYAEKVRVDLSEDGYKTYFYFVDDVFNRAIRPLVNYLKKTKNEIEKLKEMGSELCLKSYKSRNEICSELSSFCFKTINATNDVPNGIDYKFSGSVFEGIEEIDGYVVLEYSWKEFDGNILLSERFKSKTAEEKFNNKAPRENYKPMVTVVQKDEDINVRERSSFDIDSWGRSEDKDNE